MKNDLPLDPEVFLRGLKPQERLAAHYGGLVALLHSGLIQNVEKLRYETTHDDLTNSLNRKGFEEYLISAKAPQAVVLVDATNFKAVNDKYGYTAGDQLIVNTYELLRDSVRPDDVIARWGGDEFVIVLAGDSEPEVSPDDPMAYERRMQKPDHVEHIAEVKRRVAEKTAEFLESRPELKSLNFDLAVGGSKWEAGLEGKELVRLCEADLKAHKDTQHQSGQHRSSGT